MSAKTLSWVFEHSPYTGANYLIHIMLGDLANEPNFHRLFMTHSWIAQKARVSRKTAQEAIATMVEDGFLKLLEQNDKAGKPNVYKFLMPETAVQVWDYRTGLLDRVSPEVTGGTTTGYTRVSPEVTGGCNERLHITEELTQDKPQENQNVRSHEEIEADNLFGMPEPSPKKMVKGDYTPEFEAMWKLYPRAINKKGAFKCWNTALKRDTAENLTTAAGRYARMCHRERRAMSYIMHASTFFGPDEKWRDYVSVGERDWKSSADNVDEDRSGGGIVDYKKILKENRSK